MDTPSSSFIPSIQRKNGKIIIRAMLELEKVTVESVVGKICKDYNIFYERIKVENAVRDFLRNGYYLGFIDVNEDESFDINHSIKKKFEEEFKTPEAEEEKNVSQKCPKKRARSSSKTNRNQCSKK